MLKREGRDAIERQRIILAVSRRSRRDGSHRVCMRVDDADGRDVRRERRIDRCLTLETIRRKENCAGADDEGKPR
jgi:hypothetical protein